MKEKTFRPNQIELQTVVYKSKSSDVLTNYRIPQDDWFLDNNMTTIKLTACQTFCTMYKSTQTNQKKSRVILKDKDTNILRDGSVEVQKHNVRFLTEKDNTN